MLTIVRANFRHKKSGGKNMKNIIITAAFIIFALSASATSKTTDYVITENGVEYFKKVKTNSDKFIVGIMNDGTKVKLLKENVKEYRHDGVVYERKNLVKDNQLCNDCDFMELINSRNGIKIYKYSSPDVNGNLVPDIFVYNNEKFVTKVTRKNMNQIIAFFTK